MRARLGQETTWRQIIRLGEELMEKETLATRRDLILETARRLLNSEADLWLDDDLVRLPGVNPASLFPPLPPEGAMLDAFTSGALQVSRDNRLELTCPLMNGSAVMGVLQVRRPGKPFYKKEIQILEGLAGHVSLALVAAHRFAVEQWRIEQLTLVRRVSAQIANVLDLNELTRRVTRLIQSTFSYYYVALFTHAQGEEYLSFRSSAGQARGRGKPLKIRIGNGLIGSVAESGEEAITNDVHTEPRFQFLSLLSETQSEAVLPSRSRVRSWAYWTCSLTG